MAPMFVAPVADAPAIACEIADSVAVTGHIVVSTIIVSVTTKISVEDAAGQLVTDAAQEVTVCTDVAYTVRVVCSDAVAEADVTSASADEAADVATEPADVWFADAERASTLDAVTAPEIALDGTEIPVAPVAPAFEIALEASEADTVVICVRV